ncbi:hypothetical protein BGZ81_009463 [Podila clonocystis]|nr:hypothetical protein BGZ81_009463 [Podila clonocystis]
MYLNEKAMVRISLFSFAVSALVLAQAAYALPAKNYLGDKHIGQGRQLIAPETKNENSRVIFGLAGDHQLQMWELKDANCCGCEGQVYIYHPESQFYLSILNPANPKAYDQLVISEEKMPWNISKGILKGTYRFSPPRSYGKLVMDYTTIHGEELVILGRKDNRRQQQSWTLTATDDFIFNEYCESSSLSLQ